MNNEEAARTLSGLSGIGWSSILLNDNAARMAVEGAVFMRDHPKFWKGLHHFDLVKGVDEAIETLGLERFAGE